ncbi:hypothetical protein LIER_14600 [Lithospermum erythrorhizon]|uniref:Reverse transcriptase Ty1/copia-type domain-containing protein n=1 Tax=Lithospermum erythrorhizon TaxID=34254 RepID=A0AAV3Q1P2_LITER
MVARQQQSTYKSCLSSLSTSQWEKWKVLFDNSDSVSNNHAIEYTESDSGDGDVEAIEVVDEDVRLSVEPRVELHAPAPIPELQQSTPGLAADSVGQQGSAGSAEDGSLVMDIHNAFLHGDLSEEVYMLLPQGFTKSRPGLVCELHKSLYGLKKSPRCWFSKLAISLRRGYVLDIIREAGLLGAKPVSFPMEQNQCLASSTSGLHQDVKRYRRLVGRLLYLSFTRPDFSFAILVVSQFMHEPR